MSQTFFEVERAGGRDRERPRPHGRRPRVADRALVERERVVSGFLDAADASLVLLAAPAGYGKTTALAPWAEVDERPFAWIMLDGRYDDAAVLLGSIAAALDEIEPIDERVFAPFRTPSPNIRNVVVPRLCDALAGREQAFVLVLDDVRWLSGTQSLGALATIAENLPPGSQLAIAAREEPTIPLGRLRARRQLVEFRAADLAMTTEEASGLFEREGLRMNAENLGRLVERTEGWPAGLYLAALALQGETDLGVAIERFFGDDRLVADYVRDEFLSGLDAADLDFLTRTSILDRLSGPLCDAVLEREGSAETLKHLARANLLLAPLDRRDREYRYHGLLREMLESELHRLGEHEEARMHRLASAWYAEHGDLDRAVSHAISARDVDRAANLIWTNTANYETAGRDATLRRWLDRFSEAEIESSPPLCLALGASCTTRGDGRAVEHWTATAVRQLAAAQTPESAQLAVLAKLIRAAAAAREGVARMADDAVAAYELLPDDSPWRSLCCLLEGASRHLSGDRETARRMLEEGARRGAVLAPNIETLCLSQLALVALDEDDPDGAQTLVDSAISKMEHFALGDYPTEALAFAVAGLIRAGRGKADQAAQALRTSGELLDELKDFSPWYEAQTRIVLARALLLLDDVAASRARLAEAGRHLRRTGDAIVLREWLERAWQEGDAARSVTGRWPLSPAELRLLHYLPTHLTFREVAEELFVSANTVKTQARSIYQKLGVSSRAEAVACARAAGLLDTPETDAQRSPD